MTYDRIQNRRGTAAQWTSNDTTLLSGELGVETDTGKLKVGDGSTAWTARNYAGGSTNASDLVSGTLADARLSANVPLKNATNTFTAAQTFSAGAVFEVDTWVTSSDTASRLYFTNNGSTVVRGNQVQIRNANDVPCANFATNGALTIIDGFAFRSYFSLLEQSTGTEMYRLYTNNGEGGVTYFRDIQNSKMHVQYAPGNSNETALTTFYSQVVAAAGVTFVPPSSVTPANDGELTFERTSNTSLTVKLKGSDGVVRSTSLTLS